MTYIEELIEGKISPQEDQISLEDYLKEMIYITKHMSPKIKATNITTYHVMFYLSYGQNGTGAFSLPWPSIGNLCGNEKNTGVITKNEMIRERTKVLTHLGCIKITKNRTGANDFYVFRPSEISFVKQAIAREQSPVLQEFKAQNVDCYNDQKRKLKILERDKCTCVYCLAPVNENSYFLDHVIPRAKGGTNYKNNLVVSCQSCNANKSDHDVWDFLLENYRNRLLKQNEYMVQQAYIMSIIEAVDTGEP